MRQIIIRNSKESPSFDELGGSVVTLKNTDTIKLGDNTPVMTSLVLKMDDSSVHTNFKLSESLAKQGIILTGAYHDPESGEVRVHLMSLKGSKTIKKNSKLLEVSFYEKIIFRSALH